VIRDDGIDTFTDESWTIARAQAEILRPGDVIERPSLWPSDNPRRGTIVCVEPKTPSEAHTWPQRCQLIIDILWGDGTRNRFSEILMLRAIVVARVDEDLT